MRYDTTDRQSDRVEDRRGRGGLFPGGGGGVIIPIGGGGRGLGLGWLLLIGIGLLLLGINPLALLTGGGLRMPDMPGPNAPRTGAPDLPGIPGQPGVGQSSDAMAKFVRQVMADNEDVWERVFKSAGKQYQKPTLVLFSGGTHTACGPGQSAMGPFYCPLDQKIYVDLSFYDFMKRRFGASGDFAQAYVIAHEIGHHVQNLLGIADAVQEAKMRASSQAEANALQVRMELQADCLAGVWASLNDQVRSRLEQGDIEEGLKAAAAIGDDMIQRRTQGYVVPDAFTHGTSAQRVKWFRRGLEAGQVKACDTFSPADV
ncbi:MAG TPA: neutral zinc metallopeptidase [Hyphomicrobiaceae bacterium]|jgi:predicted metalloprotease|nr:neutral zinc metallopeptidase [Hyphomicrobiaceae bacterium]